MLKKPGNSSRMWIKTDNPKKPKIYKVPNLDASEISKWHVWGRPSIRIEVVNSELGVGVLEQERANRSA